MASGLNELNHIIWQIEWPDKVKQRILTPANQTGDLTINDLELAGMVFGWLILESTLPDLKHQHVGIFCDNTSATQWVSKLHTSASMRAARLLPMFSMRIHAREASSLTPLSIPGAENEMADICSRAFKQGKYFEAHTKPTTYFNTHFPLPHQTSWQMLTLPPELISRVMSCLLGDPLTMEQLLQLPGLAPNTGNTGNSMSNSGTKTTSWTTPVNLNGASSSQHLLQGSGQAFTVEGLKSAFHQSRKRSRPSPRPSNWLKNTAPSTEMTKNTSSQWRDALKE